MEVVIEVGEGRDGGDGGGGRTEEMEVVVEV